MTDHRTIVADAEKSLQALAAELTAAAYSVALPHAVGERWLDLQLDLWRAPVALPTCPTPENWRRGMVHDPRERR